MRELFLAGFLIALGLAVTAAGPAASEHGPDARPADVLHSLADLGGPDPEG